MDLPTLWSRLLLEIFLGFFFFWVLKRKRESSFTIFGYLILILIVRDLAYALVANDYILSLSNLVIISLYLIWLRTYTGPRKIDIYYLIINALFLGFCLVNIFMELLPLTQFHVTLWLLGDIIYLSLILGMVSEYSTERASLILQTRFAIVSVFLLTHLTFLLYGYGNTVIQSVMIPLSYFLHAYVIYRYLRQLAEEEGRTIALFSSNLEAMFEFMGNLGHAITEKIDLSGVLQIIVSSAVKNIGADAGAILMVDESDDTLRVRATHGIYPPLHPVPDIVKVQPSSLKRYFSEKPIRVGETVLGETAKTGRPLLIKNSVQDRRMKNNAADNILFISSIIAIPLIVSRRVLGVLSALKRAENQFFDERDLLHLRTFADYASITIDNIYTYLEIIEKRQMERELGIAAEIQQMLLPRTLPELNHALLASYSRPARGVSGDYYDIFQLDKEKIALVICDVAGKGVPAALVMIMIRSILHLIVSGKRDAAAVLALINSGITRGVELDHFATLSFLTYDQQSREVVYANAAHHPLLLFRRKSGKLKQVDAKGLPIGIEKHIQYSQKRFHLDRDDLLILYTDGIVEAMNPGGRQYSLESLEKLIEQNALLPPQELVEKIQSELKQFAGNARQHDDQTLVVLKAV